MKGFDIMSKKNLSRVVIEQVIKESMIMIKTPVIIPTSKIKLYKTISKLDKNNY